MFEWILLLSVSSSTNYAIPYIVSWFKTEVECISAEKFYNDMALSLLRIDQ